MTLDNFFLALHVQGALMWVGGLFAVMAFLDAYVGEPDAAARGRLAKHVRVAAIVPDVGLTIALVFGLHWLFRFKVYEAHFMQLKLAVVALLLGMHVVLRRKVGAVKRGTPVTAPPMALKPVVSLLALAILIFVIAKVPT
jgi:hypothetical protein